MERPSEKQLRAIIALTSRDEFSEFISWIDDSLHAQDIANRRLSGERLLQGQGKALLMDDLLTHVTGAPASLSKLLASAAEKARNG